MHLQPRTWASIIELKDVSAENIQNLKNEILRDHHVLVKVKTEPAPVLVPQGTVSVHVSQGISLSKASILNSTAEAKEKHEMAVALSESLAQLSSSKGGDAMMPVRSFFQDGFRLLSETPFNGDAGLQIRDLFDHTVLIKSVEIALLRAGRLEGR